MANETAYDKDELITLAQAAERYGFTHLYLRELARKGRMKAKKVGSIWLTSPADVEEFIRSRKRRGAYRDDIQA
jgi:excisionase family DNA binding protein